MDSLDVVADLVVVGLCVAAVVTDVVDALTDTVAVITDVAVATDVPDTASG